MIQTVPLFIHIHRANRQIPRARVFCLEREEAKLRRAMVRLSEKLSMSLTSQRRRRRRGKKSVHAKRRWSSSSPSPSPRAEEEMKKSICFWGHNEQNEMEWYVFDVSGIKIEKGGGGGLFKMGKEEENDVKEKKVLDKIMKTSGLIMPEGIALLPRHLHRGGGENNTVTGGSVFSGKGELIPFSVTPIVDIHPGRCVSIGSVIYRVGGDNFDYCNTVVSFNLEDASGGWRDCPPMLNQRCSMTRTVALDGKLYVLGGGETQHSGPWAEVYDPCLNKWEPLPPPPPPHSSSPRPPVFAAAVEASKQIVVSFCGSRHLHAFDLTTTNSSWETIDGLPAYSCFARPAVSGHTAYCIDNAMVSALDLETKTRFVSYTPINGLEDDFVIRHNRDAGVYPSLFHLSDDMFCVFYVDPPCITDPPPILSHCIKIRISKHREAEDSVLKAFVESCQSYKIDHHFNFVDSILVDGRFISGKKLVCESASTQVVSKIEGGLAHFYQI